MAVMLAVRTGKSPVSHVALDYNDGDGKARMRCGWEGFVQGVFVAPNLTKGLDILGWPLCSGCEREINTSFFEVVDMFTIKGREGVVLTGPIIGLVHVGEEMKCGDRTVKIKGVERHPVPGADKKTERRPVGLLVDGTPEDYERGSSWTIKRKGK